MYNFLIDISSTAKERLLSGEKGIVARILRVLSDSDCGAWGAACVSASALLRDLPPSVISMFLLLQPQLVATIIATLNNDHAHSCWKGTMRLLKRLLYQQASLSHITCARWTS
jgi:hypothetical protein